MMVILRRLSDYISGEYSNFTQVCFAYPRLGTLNPKIYVTFPRRIFVTGVIVGHVLATHSKTTLLK